MAFTPEQLKALAHNLGDLSGALAEFEEATPGSTLMTAGEAAAALGIEDLDAILTAQPELAGLALPRFVVQLANLSDELEDAAVSAALADLEGDVQSLVDGTAEAQEAIAHVERIEKVLGIALAALAVATSVAAAIAAPSPTSVFAAIKSANALKSAVETPGASGGKKKTADSGDA
jgi:hypothetical protein